VQEFTWGESSCQPKSSSHFTRRSHRRMACRANRAGHRLRPRGRHRSWHRRRPDWQLVVAAFRDSSWQRDRTGHHRSNNRSHSSVAYSQAGLSTRPMVSKRITLWLEASRGQLARSSISPGFFCFLGHRQAANAAHAMSKATRAGLGAVSILTICGP
jgi:hypothetical protein